MTTTRLYTRTGGMSLPKIECIYAFIMADAGPEDEGVIAARVGDMWLPLIGADMDRVKFLRPFAETVAQVTDKKIVLARFGVREDLEEII